MALALRQGDGLIEPGGQLRFDFDAWESEPAPQPTVPEIFTLTGAFVRVAYNNEGYVILGYQVATNTTVYRETDVQEIEAMFKFFSWLGCDGHTISPGYEYDAAKKDMVIYPDFGHEGLPGWSDRAYQFVCGM